MSHQLFWNEYLKSLHIWFFFTNSAHVSLARSFEFKSFHEFFCADLCLSIRGSPMNIVSVERFIKHQHGNICNRANINKVLVRNRKSIP